MAPSRTLEVNFDGLVGPTHSYAGLAFGNVASGKNEGSPSHPRAAALQGLSKMRAVAALGVPVAVMPPHERPHLPTLRALGFTGADATIVERVGREHPALLANLCSASPMWTANAATVAPSVDTSDGRVHFTVANLAAKLHRSIEHQQTGVLLRAIFPDDKRFVHHPALIGGAHFGDEGAANHTRLHDSRGRGVHLFVYGRSALDRSSPQPTKYPARQTREASQAIARLHGLDPARTFFLQQNPDVVDAGVFHNDVIAVGNGAVLLYHERAWLDADRWLEAIDAALGGELVPIRVEDDLLPVEAAVVSYFFNSQLLTLPDESMAIIAPIECRELPESRRAFEKLVDDPGNPIEQVCYLDLRQSMQNGGGPACLRLRVPLTGDELAAAAPGVMFDDPLFEALTAWVQRYYRESLRPSELGDPQLLRESRDALDALTALLELGSVYPFQRTGSTP